MSRLRGPVPAAAGITGSLVLCSTAVIAILGRWEGEGQYTVYPDRLAGNLPTVCKGLTKHITTTPIVIGETWSAEKCEREERAAIAKVQVSLQRCFTITPPQSVFDAATSHAWNFGAPSTCGSSAMKAWSRGEWSLGCRRIQLADDGKPAWSYVRTGRLVGGKAEYKFVRGLANRREAERELCVKDLAPQLLDPELPAGQTTAAPGYNTLYSGAVPPLRYRGETTVTITTVKPSEIGARCAGMLGYGAPVGHQIDGCTVRGVIYMPNPCAFPNESWAGTACHEIGHTAGWSAWHPQ